jgi:hypothetical protein
MKSLEMSLCLLLAVSLLPASAAESPPLRTYSASYEASYAGLTATAYRELRLLTEGQYELEQNIEVRVLGARLGAVEEISRFDWSEDWPVPLYYDYVQSGISSREESVEFDWQSGQATSRDDDRSWRVDILPGVLDKLSFQAALRYQLSKPHEGELAFSMVDGDEVEHHVYQVGEAEIIETGLGRLQTVRVERVREEGSNRRTIFWLATDWDYLLVRFLQSSGSGGDTELVLQEAMLGEQQVSPLP